jgi:hypothetical protein
MPSCDLAVQRGTDETDRFLKRFSLYFVPCGKTLQNTFKRSWVH